MPETQEIQVVRNKTGYFLASASVLAAVSAACVMIPMFVIRPFRPQGARELEVALAVRHAGPWLAGLCTVFTLIVVVYLWKTTRIGARIALVCLFLLSSATAA